MTDDRRKYKRFQDKLVVVCLLPGDSRLEKIHISEDISRGGIRLIASERLSIEEIMTLELNIYSDAMPIFLKGKVVWIKEIQKGKLLKKEKRYMLGIKFVDMDSLTEDRMLRYIARMSEMKKEEDDREPS